MQEAGTRRSGCVPVLRYTPRARSKADPFGEAHSLLLGRVVRKATGDSDAFPGFGFDREPRADEVGAVIHHPHTDAIALPFFGFFQTGPIIFDTQFTFGLTYVLQ